MGVREKVYRLIGPHSFDNDNVWSSIYHWMMFIVIMVSIIPLMFRHQPHYFLYFDVIPAIIFIIDYILRWITADYDLKMGKKSFLVYPFTPMAIIDLLSILPSAHVLNPAFKTTRLIRMLRIVRVIKFVRYFEPLEVITTVIRKQWRILGTVASLAVFYTFITALIMFNAEEEIDPETGDVLFTSFFDALYWAACTLTTVGYGDLYPITGLGRLISMISAFVGIAIIALPSGVITAGYLEELKIKREQQEAKEKEKEKEKEKQSESQEP